MTIEEIKELLRVFNESGVGELELQRGKDLLRIRKAVDPVSAPATQTVVSATSKPQISELESKAAEEPPSNETLVKSPIVGTFYECPSPGAPAFVKVGDAVEPGQVLCIIESMKLMNEIEAEVAGVISAKLVENGRPVEYGEALFAIRPR
jgi:acetyl-CoA carboxylase biotin carboxyl carrier protein